MYTDFDEIDNEIDNYDYRGSEIRSLTIIRMFYFFGIVGLDIALIKLLGWG